jgi:hypothetical protein
MTEFSRAAAIDRAVSIVETVEDERMPVPVREVWVYGDVALGLDPIDRLDVYVTKDLLFDGDDDRESEFADSHGVRGVGETVRADWADEHPQHLRANANGYAAPEKCLAAHLLPDDEPVHLEVCNTGFEDNVTQRARGAQARETWSEVLDPRGVCLWVDDGDGGVRSDEAIRKLRESELAFPTLPEALGMLGLEESEAATAADAVAQRRASQETTSVRGDVV